jgi:addiction module HigA family antidote
MPAAWAIHPGEILREEFLKPLRLSVYALAKGLRVPAQGINDVVLEKRGVSPATALRLAQFLGTTAEFWMNIQAAYELAAARRSLKKEVRKIRPVRVA